MSLCVGIHVHCVCLCVVKHRLSANLTQNRVADLTSSALATMAILSGRKPYSSNQESVNSDVGGKEAGTSPQVVLIQPQLQKQSLSFVPTPLESVKSGGGGKVAETPPQSMLVQLQPQEQSCTSPPTLRKSVRNVNSDGVGGKVAGTSQKIMVVQPQLRSLLTNSM